MMIDNEVAESFIRRLSGLLCLPIKEIEFEVQDDWGFLLITVMVEGAVSLNCIRKELISAQTAANEDLPTRIGEITWMINAKQNGVIVESVFGGDSASPSLGLL